jgi:hypothetical protein
MTDLLGSNVTPFAGVVDGGDVVSVKFTAEKFKSEIKDQTCICHQLNNLIKRMLDDYLGTLFVLLCNNRYY